MVATPEKPNTDKPAYKVVGTRPVRPDGVDKVTGRAEYGADIKLEGMLYGAVLRSPHAHARIKRIDTSKAEALPGVKAVATHADFPKQESGSLDLGEGSANPLWLVENVLAGSKVLYHGHAVAAVAATSNRASRPGRARCRPLARAHAITPTSTAPAVVVMAATIRGPSPISPWLPKLVSTVNGTSASQCRTSM